MKLKVLVVLLGVAVGIALAQEAKKSPRVLLALEKTRFKKQLVEKMEKLLAGDGYEVSVLMHSKKDGLKARAKDFDAVFITNSGAHSEVRPWIVAWLAANKAEKKRILLHTTQTRDWQVKADVDAVTSASSKKDVEALASNYVARVKGVIDKQAAGAP
jgi:hypothetical protein